MSDHFYRLARHTASCLVALAVLLHLSGTTHADLWSFTGGSGSPVTLTLNQAIRFRIIAPSDEAGVFVINNSGNLFGQGARLTGNIDYTINNGADINFLSGISGLTLGEIQANDSYLTPSSNDLMSVAVDDVVTLLPGSLTTTTNINVTLPNDGGGFLPFILSNSGLRLTRSGVLESDPEYPVLPDDPSNPGGDPIVGDFDVDSDVDGSDFLLWQRGGLPNSTSSSDLALWQGNYGTGSGTGTISAAALVPEPSSLALVGICALILVQRRRLSC